MGTYSVAIIPGRTEQVALPDVETFMASLVVTLGRPVALEIVGTPTERMLLVRATGADDLAQVVSQLRARYPQAEVRPLAQDPLCPLAGETVTIWELQAGAAAYLPLRSWGPRDLERPGADPLLGLLSAVDLVPPQVRVIAQVALTAADAVWSAPHQRYALEHPLTAERDRDRAQATTTDSTSLAPALLLFVAAVLLITVAAHLPPELRTYLLGTVRGQHPQLSVAQTHRLWWIGGLVLVGGGVLLAGITQVRRQWSRPTLYDPQRVQEKTERVAYRVRVRVIAISPQATVARPRWPQPGLRAFRTTAGRHEIGQWIADWRAYRANQHQWDQQRRTRLWQLVGAYRQFHLATGAFFVAHPLPYWRARQVATPTGWSRGVRRSHHLLSVADIAALWHLPSGEALPELGWMEYTRSRTRLVSAAVMQQNGYRIGVSTHGGQTAVVRIPPAMLNHNLLAVAKSGKGKSTLLQALALASMADPTCGVTLVDPHGDLIDTLLGVIPYARAADVVLIDLADTAFPIGINVLDVTAFPDRDRIVSQLIAIFSTIWRTTWGSRMEAAFEMALKSLYEANLVLCADPQRGPTQQFTLLDVAPMLSVDAFRQTDILPYIGDPVITAWWHEQWDPKATRDQVEMISPVLTKMNKFSASQIARRIVGQPVTTVRLVNAIARHQIVLLRTARGVVGDDIASIIGSSLLGLVGAALTAQAALPSAARQRMRMIVDEFQTLPGMNWSTVLPELRKYHGSFLLATQALSQLDTLDANLRPAVMANIDHLCAFTMSAEDARLIERELDSGITSADLITLDDFQCYAKLTIDHQVIPTFGMRLDPPLTSNDAVAGQLREWGRRQYAPHRAEVVDTWIQASLDRHLRYVLPQPPVPTPQITSQAPTGTALPTGTPPPTRRSKASGGKKQIPLVAGTP